MLLHIATRSAWEAATTSGLPYRPEGFETEGFIHLSRPDQVLKPAHALFRGRTGLVLLAIDPERLSAEVRWEDLYGEGESYPHLYGPLDLEAVAVVHSFEPNDDGGFELPAGL